MPPSEFEAKARSFSAALNGLRGLGESTPACAWWVPGRLEVFGKHVDYAGGRSLVAPLPAGFAVVATRSSSDTILALDAMNNERVVDPDRHPARWGWQRYVGVVASRLAHNFPGARRGVAIAFASDLPRASGMSSSSALVVSVALALIERAGLRNRPEWQRYLRRVHDLAWYLGCVENGLNFPGLPGSAGVGTHGGSEDHTAILTCQPDHVGLYRFVPVRPLGDTKMPADWTFVIASSGVQADKADSVKDRYNRAADGVRALHAIWNKHAAAPARSLADALASHPDATSLLKSRLEPTGDGRFSVADLRQRLEHFLRETARAPQAATAFRVGDAATIGALATDSQREADELLGNQIPETILLAKLAREHGAFASSSFGAGFGGSVWALVPAADAPAFGERWVGAFERAMPHVGKVAWFAARPGPPAAEIA